MIMVVVVTALTWSRWGYVFVLVSAQAASGGVGNTHLGKVVLADP